MRTIQLIALLFAFTQISWAQNDLTQTIKGQVIEKDTELPLVGANVYILGTDPLVGTSTDENG